MRTLVAVSTVVVSLAACSSAAAKAPWSASARLDRTVPASCDLAQNLIPAGCFGEPGTRVAISRKGAVIVVWTDLRQRVKAAVGDRRGRFGPTRMLGLGLRPSVTIDAAGNATAAWTAAHELRFARLPAGARRFGRSAPLAAPSTKDGDDFVHLLARPGGGATAVYERAGRDPAGRYATRLGVVELARTGSPSPPTVLGPGAISAVAASPAGDIVVCCESTEVPPPPPAEPPPTRTVTLLVRSAIGAWTRLSQALPRDTDIETVATNAGAIALGTVDVVNGGDAGTLGRPGAARGPLHGPFGLVRPAFVREPGKAFGAVAGIDGSARTVLAYQEKTSASAFSRAAPLYAMSARPDLPFRRRTQLDSTRVTEPLVQSLGAGALVAWDRGSTWGVALERAGRFRRIGSPSGGPGELGRDAITNRALATAGAYAALAWEDEAGDIRASVARLSP